MRIIAAFLALMISSGALAQTAPDKENECRLKVVQSLRSFPDLHITSNTIRRIKNQPPPVKYLDVTFGWQVVTVSFKSGGVAAKWHYLCGYVNGAGAVVQRVVDPPP